MSMTKKDYVAIAAVLLAEREDPSKYNDPNDCRAADIINNTLGCVANNLSHVFASDNPDFQRARFLAACGVR